MGNRTSPVIVVLFVKRSRLNDPLRHPHPMFRIDRIHRRTLTQRSGFPWSHSTKSPMCLAMPALTPSSAGIGALDAIGMWREEELVTHAEHFSQLKNREPKENFIQMQGTSQW